MKNCVACQLEEKGVRAKNTPKHTCAKANKDYKEPEYDVDLDCYKIYIHSKVTYSERTNSYLYKLSSQYLNGYKVKAYTELWVPDSCRRHFDICTPTFIWVTSEFYKRLSFC